MQSSPIACAIHPDLGAVFTCQRCGSFGCEDCRNSSESTLCLPCAQRVAPAGTLTAGALLQDSRLGQAFSSALFYGTLVLAWMRVTGRVPVST